MKGLRACVLGACDVALAFRGEQKSFVEKIWGEKRERERKI